jgi:hypothetical protein
MKKKRRDKKKVADVLIIEQNVQQCEQHGFHKVGYYKNLVREIRVSSLGPILGGMKQSVCPRVVGANRKWQVRPQDMEFFNLRPGLVLRV